MDEEYEPFPPLHPFCRCQILPMDAMLAGQATMDGENGADYWVYYGCLLPEYYITKDEAEVLGWKRGKNLARYAPGKMMGGDTYENKNGHLPQTPGRTWTEADFDYISGKRNGCRVVFSNDGLVFVTYDHDRTFIEIIGE